MRTAILIFLVLASTAEARPRAFAVGQKDQVTKGLVSYWSMRNSGTTVYDEWGGNNGAGNGVAFAYTNGVVGQGGSFDGVNDYVQVANDDSINFTGNFTVGAWVKFTQAQNNKGIVAKYTTGGTSRSWFLVVSQSGTSGRFSFVALPSNSWDANYMVTTTSQYNDGTWHYVTGVASMGNKNKIYVDGVLDGRSSYSLSEVVSTESILSIGSQATLGACEFNGSIDEVRIYNRALSIDEIKQLYRMGATIFNNR